MDVALRLGLLAWLLGVAAQPLAARLLPGTAGAGLARPLAILGAGIPLWWLSSVAPVYGTATAWVAVLAVLGTGGWSWRGWRPDRVVLTAEGVFLGVFALGLAVVAFAPDVVGTEKLMDQMLVNAVNASTSMPPQDPWMSGTEVSSYYYLGHFLCAWMLRVAGAQSTEGYNAALALVLALSASAAYGLGALLHERRPVAAGLAAAGLSTLGTSWGTLGELLRHEGPLGRFDWFAASRVIEDTINDWPFFAFLVGDLHAHYLATPFTMLAAALAFGPPSLGRTVAGAMTVGALYAINSWSLPVAVALFVLARRPDRDLVAVLAGAVAAILPFLITFDAGGARGLALAAERSAPGDWLLVHGAVLLPCALLLWTATRELTVLAVIGLACALVGEVLVLRDVFAGGELERLNTVFKFGYQAWLLLGVAGGVALVRVGGRRPRLVACVAAVLAAASLAGSVALVAGRTGGLRGPARLDGLRWLDDVAPGERAAIVWFRDHAPRDAVVLEAAGPEYSVEGHTRIATFTGRPSIIGMVGHEIAWAKDPGTRFEDVRRLYSGERRAELLTRYGVDYVVVGPIERATYPDLRPFAGERVHRRAGTVIYRLK